MDGDVKFDEDRTIQGIGGGALSHVDCDGYWVCCPAINTTVLLAAQYYDIYI